MVRLLFGWLVGALALFLGVPPALAQNTVGVCTWQLVNGRNVCVNVTAAAPLPVTGGGGGTLSATATATAPSYSEGTDDNLSMDLAGALRITAPSGKIVDLGAQADAACATDNGTCSAIALQKRANQLLTAGTIAVGTAGTPSSQVLTVQGITSMTPVQTSLASTTTGGCTPAKTLSAASTNATSIKGSAGTLCKITAINTTTTIYYLKFYNTASAPTCNSDAVVATYPIPPASAAGGAGGVAPSLSAYGEAYSTGIGFCITGGLADNDNANAATGIAVSYSYK